MIPFKQVRCHSLAWDRR